MVLHFWFCVLILFFQFLLIIPLCSKMSSFKKYIFFAIFLLFLTSVLSSFFICRSLSYRCHVSVLHYLSFVHMQGGRPLTLSCKHFSFIASTFLLTWACLSPLRALVRGTFYPVFESECMGAAQFGILVFLLRFWQMSQDRIYGTGYF